MERRLISGTDLHWHESSDRHQLAQALGVAVAERLERCIAKNGSASLVVSGGSTPAPLFDYLCATDIHWSRVQVTLADERWVAPDHPDSNESLVRSTLLTGKAAAAHFIPLFRDKLTPAQAIKPVSDELRSMQQPFSVVILGMGNDGHTASLFPDAPPDELKPAMAIDSRDIVTIMHPPSQALTRISLTRSALLNSEHRYLYVTGEDKLLVLNEALGSAPEGRYSEGSAPIVGLLDNNAAAASVYWAP